MSPAGGYIKPQTAGNDLANLGSLLSLGSVRNPENSNRRPLNTEIL